MREIIREIQSLRKKAKYEFDEQIKLFYDSESVSRVIQEYTDEIQSKTVCSIEEGHPESVDASSELDTPLGKIWLGVLQ